MKKELITSDMTVRDVNLKYPACKAVFETHGMGGCGGDLGPPEPIDFFARAHNVPLEVMLQELNEAARSGKSPAPPEPEKPNELYRPFVKVAIIATLTLGTAWGVGILTQIAAGHDFKAPQYASTQAHGHAQIFGWVGLFIVGVAYYTLPKFKNYTLRRTGLAIATFWMLVVGILIRGFSQPLAKQPFFADLTLFSSFIELTAIAIFAALMLEILTGSTEKTDFYEKYLLAGTLWFVVLGVLNVLSVLDMARRGDNILIPVYNDRILHVQTAGFIVNFILGVSLRILPNFMGLRQPLEKVSDAAFWLFNGGILLRFLGIAPPIVSSSIELAGGLLYVHALGIFTQPLAQVSIPGVDRAYEWFVRLGYGWFMAAAAMLVGADIYLALKGQPIDHAYIGAYRHAITVGFISTLMLGVAYRILPIFAGTELRSPRMMRASFYLILIGNIFRVGFQLLTMTGVVAFYALMGSSGYFELTALALFGWNILVTIRPQEDLFKQDHVVRPSTRVADILSLYPELRMALVQSGFSHLASAPRIPGFVTLDFAARRHGLDPEGVAERLNAIIRINQEREKVTVK